MIEVIKKLEKKLIDLWFLSLYLEVNLHTDSIY